jgi:hypothetical protein
MCRIDSSGISIFSSMVLGVVVVVVSGIYQRGRTRAALNMPFRTRAVVTKDEDSEKQGNTEKRQRKAGVAFARCVGL